MSRLLNFLRVMDSTGQVGLTSEFLRDVKWWRVFAPTYNGVSLMPLVDWTEPDVVASCDACLRGCGGWSHGKYFHAVFPEFILRMNLHINALELLTVMVTLKIWGSGWKGVRFKIFCDNEASVTVLNSGRTRDPFMQACVREILWLCSTFQCEIRACHLEGSKNRIPDLLSRWDFSPRHKEEFLTLTCDTAVAEYKVSENLFKFSHDW